MAALTLHAPWALGIRPPGALPAPSALSRAFLTQGGNWPFLRHPDFPQQEPDSAPCGCPGCTLTSTPWEPSVALSEDGPEPRSPRPQVLPRPCSLWCSLGEEEGSQEHGRGSGTVKLPCVKVSSVFGPYTWDFGSAVSRCSVLTPGHSGLRSAGRACASAPAASLAGLGCVLRSPLQLPRPRPQSLCKAALTLLPGLER